MDLKTNENKKYIEIDEDNLIYMNEYINSLNVKNKYKFLYEVSEYIDSFEFGDVFMIIKKLFSNNKLYGVLTECVKDDTINITNVIEDYKTGTFVAIFDIYCDLNGIKFIMDDYNFKDINLDDNINDSVRLYLNEISQYPLLSSEEEKKLFIKLKNGDTSIKDKIINSNLRLVISIAKKYANRGIPFLDLIQEGNIGLMKAVDKFDVSKGYKFSTYATWWIMQAITRSIVNDSRTIRIPVHIYEKNNNFLKVRSRLSNELGREPNVEELAIELDMSVDEINKLITNIPNVKSLNSLVGDEKDAELIDFIPDEENNLIEIVFKDLFLPDILSLMNEAGLKKREKDILCLRLGIYDGNPLTLEAISKNYGVTRERIRQIESVALRRLNNIMKKHDYYNETDSDKKKKRVIDSSYLSIFEKCEDFNKFDSSRMYPRFPDNTQMSTWFSSNMIILLNSKNERYKLIQKQYQEYKDKKRKEKELQRKEKRDAFFSKPNEFGIGKEILISSKPSRENNTFILNNENNSKDSLEQTTKQDVKNEFYAMFDGTIEEVDYILENCISEKQRNLIIRKWGGDLKKPVKKRNILSNSENNLYYVGIKRIKFLLEKKHSKTKPDIKDDNSKEQLDKMAKKRTTKKLQTIYEYFKDYSKEEIDDMIGKLNEQDKRLLELRYGGNLENPVTSEAFGKKETTRFYGSLIPKMRRLLSNPNEEKNIVDEKPRKEDVKTPVIMKETKKQVKYDDNEAYLKLYELFNMPYFIHALSKIDPRDYKVLFLRLNYPDKSLEEIANFTGISKEILINIFSHGAEELRLAIDNLINEAFGISDSEEKTNIIKKKDNV